MSDQITEDKRFIIYVLQILDKNKERVESSRRIAALAEVTMLKYSSRDFFERSKHDACRRSDHIIAE